MVWFVLLLVVRVCVKGVVVFAFERGVGGVKVFLFRENQASGDSGVD